MNRHIGKRPTPGTARGDERAISSIMGVVLLVGMTVGLAAIAGLAAQRGLGPSQVAVPNSEARAESDGTFRTVLLGPESLPLDGGRLLVDLQGVRMSYPLTVLQGQLGAQATTWQVGQSVCIAGPPPCVVDYPGRVGVTVAYDQAIVFSIPAALRHSISGPQSITVNQAPPLFTIQIDGAVLFPEDRTVTLTIVGVQPTVGVTAGPPIIVTGRTSTNGGQSYTPLWNGAPIVAGTSTQINVPASGHFGMEASATRPGLAATYNSFAHDGHVYVLGAGDAVPGSGPYQGNGNLKSYLLPFVDPITKTIILEDNQVLLVFEFASNLQSIASDHQDLVVLLTVV